MRRATSTLRTAVVLAVACAAAAALIAEPAVAAPAGWTARAITPGPLLSVAATDPLHAWAVGPGPTIVATTDGGKEWAQQDAPTQSDLYAVTFADAADGWAVGTDGAILTTTDGGAEWTSQTSPASVALIGAAARGGDCWAVGEHGTVIATTDGGADWTAQATPTPDDLYAVTFADSLHGWAVGDAGTILATTDGGADWTAQRAPTGAYLNGVACHGALHAWAVGERGIVLATTDGGAHWAVVRGPGTAGDLYTTDFVDARHGWAVGAGGLVLATVDGGLTWRGQPDPARQDVTSVAFVDALHGFAGSLAGEMLSTRRGGWTDAHAPTTWTVGAARWHDGAARVSVHASDDGGSGIATVQYSFDRGATWTRGSAFTVAAPADHSGDGIHSFLFRAIDNAGNVAPARRGWVGIDTRRPTPLANWAGAARRGARSALRFFVRDSRPGSPTATVTIRIVDTRGGLVEKVVLRGVPVQSRQRWVFTCRLPRGRYRFTVAATDAAGNRQTAVAGNRLVVR
jgi:photosystem II stability/assembly factor-like uncharacterized protein